MALGDTPPHRREGEWDGDSHSTHAFVASLMRKASDQALEDVAMSQKGLPLFPRRLAGSGKTKGERADASLYVVIRT